ncbi:MAG TPA: hypothetical protein VN541_00815 [Tepidisphaeraceae bacterium]|nr:hypothetical protein [Tepidisphaeraceae bacterium]
MPVIAAEESGRTVNRIQIVGFQELVRPLLSERQPPSGVLALISQPVAIEPHGLGVIVGRVKLDVKRIGALDRDVIIIFTGLEVAKSSEGKFLDGEKAFFT